MSCIMKHNRDNNEVAGITMNRQSGLLRHLCRLVRVDCLQPREAVGCPQRRPLQPHLVLALPSRLYPLKPVRVMHGVCTLGGF